MLSADAAGRNFGKIYYFTRFQTALRCSPADAAGRNFGKIYYFTRFQTVLRCSPADAAARNFGKIYYFTRFQTALRRSPAERADRHRGAPTCPNYTGLVRKPRRQKHDGAEHAERNGDGKDWVALNRCAVKRPIAAG